MADWTDARIGYGRIGFLPIGGRFSAPDPSGDLPQGKFIIELRSPGGELLAYLNNAIKPGYEELVGGVGQAWLQLDVADSKWAHVAQGNIVVIRERGQRPKTFKIKGIEEARQ